MSIKHHNNGDITITSDTTSEKLFVDIRTYIGSTACVLSFDSATTVTELSRNDAVELVRTIINAIRAHDADRKA